MPKKIEIDPTEVPHEPRTRRIKSRVRQPDGLDTSGAPAPVPESATRWKGRDEHGVRLAWYAPSGAEHYEWPMRDFTVDTIRERWGGGLYTVLFFDAGRGTRGKVQFRIAGPPKPRMNAPAQKEEDAHTAMTGPFHISDPSISSAMALLGVMDNLVTSKANAQAQLQTQFLIAAQENTAKMFESAMRREAAMPPPAAPALPVEVVQLLTQMNARLAALEGDASGEQDDDDDGDRDVPALPDDWDGVGQMLYRVLARQLPALEQVLPDLVKGYVERIRVEAMAKAANGGSVQAHVVGR